MRAFIKRWASYWIGCAAAGTHIGFFVSYVFLGRPLWMVISTFLSSCALVAMTDAMKPVKGKEI